MFARRDEKCGGTMGAKKTPSLTYPQLTVAPDRLAPAAAIAPRTLQFRSPVVEQAVIQLGGTLGWDERHLSASEVAVARPVFEASLDYDAVRVITSHVANAPTTLGHHIRIPPRDSIGQPYELDALTLVHELTHIWQYQTRGGGYISSSIGAQCLTEGRFGAYIIHASQLLGVRSIGDLSAERQARVVELYLLSQQLRSGDLAMRRRVERESRHVLKYLTLPSQSAEQFERECGSLDRMIDEIRRACPLSHGLHYREGLHGLAQPLVPAMSVDGHEPLHAMPFFRIDF